VQCAFRDGNPTWRGRSEAEERGKSPNRATWCNLDILCQYRKVGTEFLFSSDVVRSEENVSTLKTCLEAESL
jgi:hypothetical protein